MTDFIVFMAKFVAIGISIIAVLAAIFIKSDEYPKSSPSDDASTNVGIGGGI